MDDEGLPPASSAEGPARHGVRRLRLFREERRFERELLAQYEQDLDLIQGLLAPDKVEAAAALASVPSLIRGYGHVKRANADTASGERARLLKRFSDPPVAPILQAAE